MEKQNSGLVLVFTGDGKGKSTAAFGLGLRALGNKQKICIIQFLKSSDFPTGEYEFFKKNNAEIHTMGAGFTNRGDKELHKKAIVNAWKLAKEKLYDKSYDLVILDEINNTLALTEFTIEEILPINEVIKAINDNRQYKNIVLSGRSAKEEVIEVADLVTEMRCIKHYYDKGINAKKGVEY